MKRIGLVGWFDAHNIGDELARHVVQEGLQRRFPCEVDALSTARFLSARHCGGVVSLQEECGAAFWRRYDAICWGPGGIMPGAFQLLEERLPPLDVPQVIISSAWAPGAAVGPLLARCCCAWSRVPLTTETPGLPVMVAPDVAYGLRVQPVAEPTDKTVLVCPSYRCPPLGRRRLRAFIASAQRRGYEVILYPVAASPGDMDILACDELARATGARCYVDVPNWRETMYMIRRAALVVSFRKHVAVLAQMLGVPSVVCDYWGNFGPMQDVARGDSLLLGGPREGTGDVGTDAQWQAALEHRTVSFEPEQARRRVNAALDAVAEAIA
jgi:hypothetical protein